MRARIFALTLAAVAATACDKATAPSSSLTPAEVRAIMVAIDQASTTAVNSGQAKAAELNLTPVESGTDVVSRTGTFNFSGQCDLGGTAAVAGSGSVTVNVASGTMDIAMNATGTYANCAFPTENSRAITVDGSVQFGANRHTEKELSTESLRYVGAVDYSTSDGKEGTCPIDLTVDVRVTPESGSQTVVGKVCDQSVNTVSNVPSS